MLRKRNKGQTSLEYTMMFIVVIGSLLAIQNYVKRGVQGRWKDTVDGLGDQYDPRTAITDVRHRMTGETKTQIIAQDSGGGYWTSRTDHSTSTETKTGNTTVGAY